MVVKSKYKRVTAHNHLFFPGKKQVQRSRLVMAEYLGRPLLSTEHVHHKNEDTMDDRRRNLKIMMHGKHVSHHNLGNKYNSGKHPTLESKKKMSLAQKGKVFTAETKKKISLALKGHPPTPGMSGKHHTSEARYKMSVARKGKPSNRKGKHLSVKPNEKFLLP